MFFILSKVLAFIIKPLVWIGLTLILGLKHRQHKKGRNWLVVSVFMLWFFTNTLVFETVMTQWELRTKTTKSQYDYGVVLGGMAYYNDELNQINFLRSADRLWQAVEQYNNGTVKRLFISGGSGSLLHSETRLEAEMLRDYLLKLGIPEGDILFETNSKNTHQNAVFTLQELASKPQSSILLFTSAFHLRRAKGCFQVLGKSVDVFATDSYVSRPRNILGLLLIPNDETLRGWTILCKELVGYLVYKIIGYC